MEMYADSVVLFMNLIQVVLSQALKASLMADMARDSLAEGQENILSVSSTRHLKTELRKAITQILRRLSGVCFLFLSIVKLFFSLYYEQKIYISL